MLRLQRAPRLQLDERFDSDRESLPFPRGGVFGRTSAGAADAGSTQNGAPLQSDYAVHLLNTIDHMQSSLDALEQELGAELAGDLEQMSGVIGRIGAEDDGDDWPPTAA